MSKILSFYETVLHAFPYVVGEDGLISSKNPTGAVVPATIDGKRLVLPTPKWMKDGFGEDFQPFHPLSEQLSRKGTSPVLQHMQKSGKAILAHTVAIMATELLKVAADTSLHKDLPPECKDYLKKLTKANKDTVTIFTKIMNQALKKNKLITVYLKHGGKFDGKAVNRLCVIRFPLLEILDGTDEDVLGVTVSATHRKTISALMRMIVPGGDEEEYCAGSDNRVAPYFHAFLKAYLKIATQLNKVIKRYAQPMALNLTEFKLYSEKDISKLSDFYEDLPTLRGNEGGVDEVDEEAAPAVTVQAKTTTTAHAPHPRPAAAVAAPDEGGMSMEAFRKQMNPMAAQQQPQQSVYSQQPYNPYGGGPMYDPSRPSWLVGNQPAMQPQQSPFAMAVTQTYQQQPQQVVVTNPAMMGYNNGFNGPSLL
jgi:hypothetical protein